MRVGDRLEPLVKPPIERLQLVKYAGASGDWNPIHVDEPFAKAAGYPSVFAHGMLSMGFLGELLAHRFGVGKVRRLQVRFKAITWPGDVVTCHGEVTAVTDEAIELRVWTETEKGVTLDGTATVAR